MLTLFINTTEITNKIYIAINAYLTWLGSLYIYLLTNITSLYTILVANNNYFLFSLLFMEQQGCIPD